MTDILNIGNDPIFDDHMKLEVHTYNPFANTTFGHSDEIRIPIQQQDLYTLPCESFLYIEEKLTINKEVAGFIVILGNNCIAFMFVEIRYELDSVEIDRNRNVEITSTLKNYVTVSFDRSVILRNAGWDAHTDANGYLNFCIALHVIRILRKLQTRSDQRSLRIDFDTIAQRQQLPDRKFSAGTRD